MLAGGHVISARGVHDHDTFFACRIDIDVFETDPRSSNDLEILSRFDQLPGDFCPAANDPAIVVSDNLLEFLGVEPDPNIDFKARSALENFQSLRRQGICDENFHGLIQSLHQYFLSRSDTAAERNLGAEFS